MWLGFTMMFVSIHISVNTVLDRNTRPKVSYRIFRDIKLFLLSDFATSTKNLTKNGKHAVNEKY